MQDTEQLIIDEAAIWSSLRDVPDPELPTINLVDLGVILRVELAKDGRHAQIYLLPTFLGCPALELMQGMIRERLAELGVEAEVHITRKEIWSSDRISEHGRQRLAEAGIAPPGPSSSSMIQLLEPARCPHCGSRGTSMESLFGPTPCRAINYCRDCRQPFEQFKPL